MKLGGLDRRLVLLTLRGSRVHQAQELADRLEREWELDAQRKERGRNSGRKVGACWEAGILRAIRHLQMPLKDVQVKHVLRAIDHRGPKFFDLPDSPCERTVRRVLRIAKGKATSSCIGESSAARDDDGTPTQDA